VDCARASSGVSAVALALFSLGAASGPGAPTGKFAGFFAGVILIALVGYAFFDYLRPAINDPDSGLIRAILVLAAIAIIKVAVMPSSPASVPTSAATNLGPGKSRRSAPRILTRKVTFSITRPAISTRSGSLELSRTQSARREISRES